MSAETVANSILANHFASQLSAVEACTLYFHNVSPGEQIQMLFDSPSTAYADAWLHRYRSGFIEFWGNLDLAHKRKYLDAALQRYEDEATQRTEGT